MAAVATVATTAAAATVTVATGAVAMVAVATAATAADKTAYEANLTATGRKAANYKYFAYGTYGANATIADYSGIPIRKFDDPKAPFATSASTPRVSTRDVIVSRLSDAYLIAAEA